MSDGPNDELMRTVRALEAEVAVLRAKVEKHERSTGEAPAPADVTNEAPVSRRSMLVKLSAAAAGGGALAATGLVGGGRAAAADGDFLVLGENNPAATNTRVGFSGAGVAFTVAAEKDSVGVQGASNHIGLWGYSTNSRFDTSRGEHVGVLGQADNLCNHQRVGVRGRVANGPGTGVEGISTPLGYGVRGLSGRGFGVRGEVDHTDGIGVAGAGPGVGVQGEGGLTGVRGVGGSGGVGIFGRAAPYGYGVRGVSEAGFGVLGEVTTGVAVSGESSDNGWGVRGNAVNGGWGVQGISDTSFGVRGDSTGGTGVRGSSQTDIGVYGRSIYHTGVIGYGAIYGVQGQCDAGGTAVVGTVTSGGYGVRGEAGTGTGVSGTSDSGVAVSGQGRLGGQFQGTRAAVRLVPTAYVGPPTTGNHLRGEMVCDKNGQFWACKGDGVPGTWVQFA